ncbi:helicase associated domain-containing protein [Arthrobacter sp. KK5.5]|uniref:helicase associated domain-containing protein n=1 Tax=Arthrobacter sp. KK5.5 TaxID=3373084 RepID=UPI003EE5732E
MASDLSRGEWEMMYRKGVEVETIARLCHTTPSAVRSHVTARIRDDPRPPERRPLRHTEPSLPRHARGTTGTQWRLWHRMLLGFVNEHHRLPGLADGRSVASALELALHLWLREQRAAHRRGDLQLMQHTAMARIPGWRRQPVKSRDSIRWDERLEECAAFLTEHGRFPSGSKPVNDEELVLGRWLVYQRRLNRLGSLDPLRSNRLDARLPGWSAHRKARRA